MEIVRATFTLANYTRDKRVSIDALVDRDAAEVIVTADIAQ